MDNNDILRRIRYIFDISDDNMIKTFAAADMEVTRAEVSAWLKSDDDPDMVGLYDKVLATFLNGFINVKRGKREGPQPKPEKTLNNNLIMRKLKIALTLRDEDIVGFIKSAGLPVSKHEVNAFFRKPEQRQYRRCLDQFLRNMLVGMQNKYRKD